MSKWGIFLQVKTTSCLETKFRFYTYKVALNPKKERNQKCIATKTSEKHTQKETKQFSGPFLYLCVWPILVKQSLFVIFHETPWKWTLFMCDRVFFSLLHYTLQYTAL